MKARPIIALSAASLILAACSGGDTYSAPTPAPGADQATAEPSGAAADASSTAHARVQQVEFAGRTMEIAVGPIVLDKDGAVLKVTSRQLDGPRPSGFDMFAATTPNSGGGTGFPMRLVNPTSSVAYEATNFTETPLQGDSEHPAKAYYSLFDVGDITADAKIDAFLPGVGYVDDVEVVTAGSPGDFGAARITYVAPPDFAGPLVAPLEAYVEAIDQSRDTTVGAEGIATNLSSDVLFDVDSADLRSGAQPVLASLGRQLTGYPGGTVQIIGHTDDVADDAYNLALSERCAQSVQAALTKVTDVNKFDVIVEGKGESDPRDPGTDDAAGRRNRRVEIYIKPNGQVDAGALASNAAGALPPAPPATGKGPAGVDVPHKDGSVVHMAMEQVRRRGDLLIGTLTITAKKGEPIAGTLLANSSIRGHKMTLWAPSGVHLLSGGNRVAPMVYSVPGHTSTTEEWRLQLLVEKMLATQLEEGQSVPTTIVWPDTGEQTVTVGYEYFQSEATPFRLTDIPVVDDPVR